MTLRGSINKITSKMDLGGVKVHTLTLQVFGDISAVYQLLETPLTIELTPE